MPLFWESCWKQGAKLKITDDPRIVQCEPGWQWQMREFVDFDLWIVLEGSGAMTVNDRTYRIERGFSQCFPPGRIALSASHDPKHPLMVFYCHFTVRTRFEMEAPALSMVPRFYDPASPVLDWTRDVFGSYSGMENRSMQEILLWQLLLQRERQGLTLMPEPEERMRRIASTIRQSPAAHYRISELARNAGMSEGHFRRQFKALTGKAPLAFILHCRIDRACRYLRESRMSVQEIAAIMGYGDIFHFSRQFKAVIGQSPRAYRKRSVSD